MDELPNDPTLRQFPQNLCFIVGAVFVIFGGVDLALNGSSFFSWLIFFWGLLIWLPSVVLSPQAFERAYQWLRWLLFPARWW